METDPEIQDMLKDLLWLNAVIATEIIQITENTSALLQGSPPPVRCLEEHQTLRTVALTIAEKYRKEETFRMHLTGHR